MAYFDSNKYRDAIRKRLDESDTNIGSISINDEAQKPQYETDVLSKLRSKLFGQTNEGEQDDNYYQGTRPASENPEAAGDTSEFEAGFDANKPEYLKTEDTYQDSPKSLDDEKEPNLSTDDLGDMATDTIMDILGSIKELRDKVKKEDPKKAALIRRIYDHLLKGKEKITADIVKAAAEENGNGAVNAGNA